MTNIDRLISFIKDDKDFIKTTPELFDEPPAATVNISEITDELPASIDLSEIPGVPATVTIDLPEIPDEPATVIIYLAL